MNKQPTKAFMLNSFGHAAKAFQLTETFVPLPNDDEVLIECEAFGLNYADVMARKGKYPEMPPLPCVIGYEVVGKIVAVGSHVSQDRLNQRVVAFCRFGGYAKHTVTKDYAAVEIGNEPAEKIMALCTQAVTAYYMSYHLTNIHPGDKVLIHAAAGGVGSILVQLAKHQGAEVFAKIGDASKTALVEALGCDHVIHYNQMDYENQINRILGLQRLDVSFNPSAGSTLKKDWRLLGSGGRLVLFGAAELSSAKWGLLSKLNFVRKMGLLMPIELMMRSKSIMGVNMLKIADNRPNSMTTCLREVMKLYRQGVIKPQVGGVFPYNELQKAHEALESGKSTGKLTVCW